VASVFRGAYIRVLALFWEDQHVYHFSTIFLFQLGGHRISWYGLAELPFIWDTFPEIEEIFCLIIIPNRRAAITVEF